MEFVEYQKIRKRMTKWGGSYCEVECARCPIGPSYNRHEMACSSFERNFPEEAEAIVKKWAEEHPVKTRQTEFLKHYPDAKLDESGVLVISPEEMGCKLGSMCYDMPDCKACRERYWSAEVEK